ncbi:MAG TPA: BON domain-containing protein [Solirubrobacterales bacterium]|nr:BON domain-containing protein [Solirubrobacterales bacterium]
MTRAKAKTVSGTTKGGASAIRSWIAGGGSTVKGTQKQTQRQARQVLNEARKQARRQATRARIAAAKARAQSRAKASGVSTKAIGAAGAAGLLAGYFLDPDSGKRRRHVTRDRALGLFRRGADRARRQAEYRAGQVEGKVEAAKSKTAPEKPAANDQALAERVKSEIFQPADAPKDSVNINVEDGVVYLRGQVKRPDEIRKLVKEAESVDGVRGVENLLHTA